MKNIEILYEDDFFLVVNKPAGLAVQGGKGINVSLDKILDRHLKDSGGGQAFPVHRLDRDTSGVILTAKTKDAAASISRLFNSNRTGKESVKKQYIAVCSGCPINDGGSITLDLMIRDSIKKSETRYKVIKNDKLGDVEFSALELELGTGRMHQIRRHLAMCQTPILGDDKYGDFSLNKILRKSMGLKRLLLHASRLVVKGGYNLEINAPLPEYFMPYFK